MGSTTTRGPMGGRLGGILISVAAALVILGVAIVPFLTPAWIHGEQDRAGAPGFVGAPPEAVHWDADQIVSRLVFGGSFEVTTDRLVLLLDAKEQAHMQDVRGVFDGLAIVILAGAGVLAVAARRSRSNAVARQALWRAVGLGARALAVAMAAIGILSVVAFDAAFQVFHKLLFPAGSFSFDPATERLVQLFPDQFWSDTALALGLVALVLSIGVALLASRRAARPIAESAVAPSASSLTPRSIP